MRFLVIVSVLIAGLFFVSVPIEDRNHAKIIAEEIYTMFSSSEHEIPTIEPIKTLEPGLSIYNFSGERIGSVVAFTRRNGDITKVWTHDLEFDGSEIVLKRGRVIYSSPRKLSSNKKPAINALP